MGKKSKYILLSMHKFNVSLVDSYKAINLSPFSIFLLGFSACSRSSKSNDLNIDYQSDLNINYQADDQSFLFSRLNRNSVNFAGGLCEGGDLVEFSDDLELAGG